MNSSSFSFGYSPKLLEAILNSGTDYICVKDRQGRFVYINERDASLYNAKPAEILGRTVEPWVGRAQFEEWARQDLEIINLGRPKNFEPYARTGKDEITRWFDTVKIPFFDEQRGEDLLLVIHRDITKIVEAEMERNALRDQMLVAHRLETIGKLSASVAHEFNNILTVIQASASLLTRKANLDSEGQFLVQGIAQSAGRAAEVVTRLLLLSRRETVEHACVHLQKLLFETRGILQAALGHKIELTLEVGPEDLPIKGNGTMVEQALINLALNARDAMSNGGTFAVKAGLTVDGDGLDLVIVEVRDTGVGMSPEVLTKAFDPFYTTKTVGQGSGLGLAVVRRIMELHNGRIEAESRPNEGARFVLTFPKALSGEPDPPVPATVAPASLAGKTVLLVDDEELVRELLRFSLDAMGIHTVEAANGDQAWKIISESGRKFDCVLTDVVMDGELDGVSLRMKIAAHDPKIPVIIMTGHSFNYFPDPGAVPEHTDILYKPFLPEALKEKLRSLIPN